MFAHLPSILPRPPVHKPPDVAVKRSKLFPHFEERSGVVNCGVDFQFVADDTGIPQQLARENGVLFSEDGRVWIAGTDVTSSIRETRVDRMVPVVARHHAVREVMRDRQRELGRDGDVVIEGRDIGTVVAPDAEVKVFLVADRAERAKRRVAERPGIGADALATDLRLRDESDAARMQPAADATEIDTTSLQVDDVVDRIEALVRERTAA